MNVRETPFEGLLLLEPEVFADERGFFLESWSRRLFAEAGLPLDFVQDNHSYSVREGTLRGIHFQRGAFAQTKLVRCVTGAVLDVAVDLRPGSATRYRHFAALLSEENRKQLLIPAGFGHAFLTLTDGVHFLYRTDRPYAPQAEGAIRWNDPRLAIDWGIEDPILSAKDRAAPLLEDNII